MSIVLSKKVNYFLTFGKLKQERFGLKDFLSNVPSILERKFSMATLADSIKEKLRIRDWSRLLKV